MTEPAINTPPEYHFAIPKRSEWRCSLFGQGDDGIVYQPLMGREPNWFHRWMQRLAFGFKWERVK